MIPAFLVKWLSESTLMQSPIGAFLKAVPRQVWIALLIIAALGAAYLWHQHAAGRAIADAEKRGADAAYTKIAQQAHRLKMSADALARTAATLAKEKNDEAHGRIDSDAGALLMRGAGKATCTGVAGSPAGTDQRPLRHHEADASLDRLPEPPRADLIAMPFAGAVAFARQNDRCLADLRAYEERDALIAAGQVKLVDGKKP